MTDQWPLGPYIVFDTVNWKKIPAGSEFEARRIADRLEEECHTEIGIYKWVADDEAYVLVTPHE